jgi:PAS domain S-box-containing protein
MSGTGDDLAASRSHTILVVDDNPTNLGILADCLAFLDCRVLVAQDGSSALEEAEQAHPDLILLDVLLPGMNGFEICRRLKANEALQDVPVIFLTALGETQDKVTAFELGAADYITKPFHYEEVLARVGVHLALHTLQRQLGTQNEQLQLEIAERGRVQEALRLSEERHRALVENTNDVIFALDARGCFAYISPAIERFALYKPDEVVGQPFAVFVHSDDLDGLRASFERTMTGSVEPYEFRVFAKDGAVHHVRTSSRPLWGEGQLVGLTGIMTDITDRKLMEEALRKAHTGLEHRVEQRTAQLARANANLIAEIAERKRTEKALRESEERYHALFEQASDAIFVENIHNEIVDVNRRACDMLGYTRDELLTMKVSDLQAPEVRGRSGTVVRDEMVRYHGAPFDSVDLHRDGTLIPVEINTTRLTGQNDDLSLSIVRDVSERKRAEERTYRLNAELEQRVIERTSQLEAANQELEAFAYSVSHDLRAPLRAMDGFSRILLQEHAQYLSGEAQHYLRRVRENAQRMGQLIDDLLAFSCLGRQALKKRFVAPAELVEQAWEDLHDEAEGRQVERIIGELPRCQADPLLLKQVFINLLSNALKFTRSREVARVEVGHQQVDGRGVYFVRDNGVGFDMRYAAKLFGVFQRLHSAEEYEGTGVGLAIVQRIVHRHGGRAWAMAETDKGATFYFTLEE